MANVSVYLTPPAVAGLREGRSVAGGAAEKLLRLTQEMGVDIKPAHALAATPMAASQYNIEVDEPSRVPEVVRKLKDCKEAVDTAFYVPEPELP
jgi:hypothetical protein